LYVQTFRNILSVPIFIGRVNKTRPMKMGQAECSETSAHKIQAPGNCPKERLQHVRLYWLNILLLLRTNYSRGYNYFMCGPGVDSASNRKGYHICLLGVKAAGV